MARIVVELSQRRARWLYLAQNFIWVWLGLACVATTILYLANPDLLQQGAIARAFGESPFGIDEAFNVLTGLGGLFIVAGVLTIRHRTELLGHIFFSGGLIINAIAIAVLFVIAFNFFLSIGAALASISRGIWLWYSINESDKERRGEEAVIELPEVLS